MRKTTNLGLEIGGFAGDGGNEGVFDRNMEKIDAAVASSGGGSASVTSNDITDATTVGKAVLTATDDTAARDAIGAGTSDLTLGTTSSTAKAGDYAPASSDISDATTVGKAVLTATDRADVLTPIGMRDGSAADITNGTEATKFVVFTPKSLHDAIASMIAAAAA